MLTWGVGGRVAGGEAGGAVQALSVVAQLRFCAGRFDGSGAAVWAGGAVESFTFGHLRQFDRANELALSRAWSLGAAPAVKEMTLDLDSTVCSTAATSRALPIEWNHRRQLVEVGSLCARWIRK